MHARGLVRCGAVRRGCAALRCAALRCAALRRGAARLRCGCGAVRCGAAARCGSLLPLLSVHMQLTSAACHCLCHRQSFIRNPKAAEEELKEAVKLHVVGLIFHGTPDTVHLFYAGPHLAGNSNLNIECIYRSILHDYGVKGMLSIFHCQFDNASDNKSRWCLGFFAWLIKRGYIREARISMMMVGHTHEDIDAIFQLISALWKRLRAVLSTDAFVRMLTAAVPNCVVHAFLEYVHDWARFFSDCIYEDVVGINTAREFIMRQRDDGGAPPHR